MVGTTPMSSPAWRQATACSCMAFADSMTAGLAGGVLVLRGGEGAATSVLVELARGGFDRLAEFGVLADELGDVVRIQAEDILNDEPLPVAIGSGADADRWDAQRLRHPLAERARDRLQDDGKGARVFQRSRIGEDLLRRLIAAALHPVAAKLVDEGGRQPEVPNHGDAHRGQLLGVVDHAAATFQLHRGDAGFLEKTAGISDRVLGGGVVGHERHIADHQRAGRSADDGTRIADHVVHRHAEGIGVAEHRRSEAVAYKQHRDSGAVQPARRAVVVAGQHRELGAFALPLPKVADVGRHAAASLFALSSFVRSATSRYRRWSSGSRFNASRCRSIVPWSPRDAGPVIASAGARARRLLTAPASSGVMPWRPVSARGPGP